MAIFLQDGKYRIEKSLGQGGFGITYLATQVNLNRLVAIKEFYPKDFCDTSQVRLTPKPGDEELVARFKRKFISEARNVAKLDHPNIVKIYDVFEENSTAYFVMEYVEGESLDAMSKCGAMSEADALRYIIPIARALEYVHSENMTHLDVKPANIMVRRKNNTPVLIDFGLAKQYDRTTGGETSTSFVGLSPGYAPIEQYNQGGVNTFSPQIDVYALGATLYRLVTGTTPPEPAMREGNDVEISAPVSAGTRSAIQHAMRMFKSNRTLSMTAFIAELSATPTPTPAPQPQTQMQQTQPQPTPQQPAQRPQRPTPQPQPTRPQQRTVENVIDGSKMTKLERLIISIIALCAAIVCLFFVLTGVNTCSKDNEDKYASDTLAVVEAIIESDDAEYQFSQGEAYHYGRGVEQDYVKAVEWYRKAAEQGYAPAQVMLGECYHYGSGVAEDIVKAVEWYRKAAEQGYAPAQVNLGNCYFFGDGIAEDNVKAVEWYRKAAEQGEGEGQYLLGYCYNYGYGVNKNADKAVECYYRAAEGGYAYAQVVYGLLFFNGDLGLEQDYGQGVEWLRKAAEQGYSDGQFRLGQCYEEGYGVEKNIDEAIKWYQKAAEQGHEVAKKRLRERGV